MEYEDCKAFDALTTKLKDSKDSIRMLNELMKPDNPVPPPLTHHHHAEDPKTNARNTYLRGAFITVMAMWEGYVQDLLEESGIIVFDSVSALDPEEKKDIIARSATHHLKGTDQKEVKEKTIALVSDIVVDLASPKASSAPIREFKAHILRKITGSIVPVFFRSKDTKDTKDTTFNGIDDAFQKLFKFTGNLSEKIAQQKVVHEFALPRSKTAVLKLDTPKGINDIIRLYYGVRCAFAHGRKEKTLEIGGALHNYPDETTLRSIVEFESIEKKLRQLYDNVKGYGSEAWVHYDHLVNLQRFVIALAFQLFKAVSCFILEKYELAIWNNPKYVIETYSDNVYWQ